MKLSDLNIYIHLYLCQIVHVLSVSHRADYSNSIFHLHRFPIHFRLPYMTDSQTLWSNLLKIKPFVDIWKNIVKFL